MHKAKLLLTFLLSLGFLSFTPLASADDSQTELFNAIEKSFVSENIQINDNGKISFGSNYIDYTRDFSQNKSKRKSETDLKIVFDTITFPDEADIEDHFSFEGELSTAAYYNESSEEIFYEVTNYKTDIKAVDSEIQTIAEGFLEIPKFFTNKMYYINFGELIEKYKEEFDDIDEFGLSSQISTEDISNLLIGILQSGIFEIENQNNLYTVYLAKETDEINFDALEEAINNMKNLPDAIKDEIIDELNYMKSDETEDINDFLDEFNRFFDFSIKIDLSYGKISTIDIEFIADTESIFENEFEGKDLDNIEFTSSFNFNYKDKNVIIPSKNAIEVNVSMILSAFITIEQKMAREMEAYWEEWETADSSFNEEADENEYEYEYEDNTYAEEETSFLNEEAWYTPHIRNLISRDIITKPKEVWPENNITPSDFISLLKNTSIHLDNNYDYRYRPFIANFSNTINEKYMDKNEISKYDALKYIIKTVSIDEESPAAVFAIKHGIVSENFDGMAAQNQSATRAEVFTMLSKAIEVHINQN